tara:strand:- start:482 stop:2854 length:2373 start_codon:yes stop_codon:yes gene_type:complete
VAESTIKLIVDAANAVSPLRRVAKETAKTEKQVSLLQKAIKAQSRAVDIAKTKLIGFGNTAKKAFATAQKAAEKFQSKLGGLKGAIVGLGAAALTKRMIGQAASFAQTQVRLKALSTEYGEFGKIQQLVKNNAKTFNQSQAESASNFADAYARLRPLGTSLEQIQTVYKGFNATALASGTSAAAASGAFLQLSQALGSGRLQGDEFRSIAEQVPGILRLVSDEMGVTVGELKKLGSDGKITSDILINSLAKGFEENKDKIQALLAESPAQKFKEFSNATSELSNSIGTELLPVVTPTVQALTEMVGVVGKLPGPMRTLAAAAIGLGAAFVTASGAASALGLKLTALIAIAGKVALLLGPIVGVALAIEDARLRKEEFDKALESTSPTVLQEALDKATKELDQLNIASKKFEDSPYYKGKIQDVNDLKERLDEAKLKVEELTKRRTLIVDLIVKSKSIAEDVRSQTATGKPGGAGFDTLTPEQLDEVLGRNKPKPSGNSTGRTGPDPAVEAKRKAEQAAQQLKDSEKLKTSLDGQFLVLNEIDESEKIRIASMFELSDINQRYNELSAAALSDREKENLEIARGLDLGIARIKQAQALEDLQSQTRQETASQFAQFFQDAAEIDKEIFDKGAKMRELYSSIGETISTGIVDSLTAAVEGTKSLAEVASDTLRSLANILLKFGINSLLGGLGESGGFLGKLFGGFKADGGTVKSGKSYMVGERGPELFSPGRSGSIAPNNSLGGTNVVVNVDASGSQAEGDAPKAKQLGSLIGAAVQAELVKQKRPGGILAS